MDHIESILPQVGSQKTIHASLRKALKKQWESNRALEPTSLLILVQEVISKEEVLIQSDLLSMTQKCAEKNSSQHEDLLDEDEEETLSELSPATPWASSKPTIRPKTANAIISVFVCSSGKTYDIFGLAQILTRTKASSIERDCRITFGTVQSSIDLEISSSGLVLSEPMCQVAQRNCVE